MKVNRLGLLGITSCTETTDNSGYAANLPPLGRKCV